MPAGATLAALAGCDSLPAMRAAKAILAILLAIPCACRRDRASLCTCPDLAAAHPAGNPATRPAHMAGCPETRPALAILNGPYLQAPAESSVTIVWTTSRPCASHVEYAETPEGPFRRAVETRHGLLDANTTLHRVTLRGLRPGATYHYRAVSREIESYEHLKVTWGGTVCSPTAAFTTLDTAKEAFSFVVLNDRHENAAGLRKALRGVDWAGVDLVFYNGDMLHWVEDEAQIMRALVQPSTDIFASRIPFVFVRGNHEARGGFCRNLLDYFPTESGRYYYTLDHGPVRFIVMDAGEDKTDTHPELHGLSDFASYVAEQTDWLRSQILHKRWREAAFRVALVHMPPGNSADKRLVRREYMMDNWVPLLSQGRLDLMLCGHFHIYAHSPPREGRNFHIVQGGTDTVIRVDATESRLAVATTTDLGLSLGKIVIPARRPAQTAAARDD